MLIALRVRYYRAKELYNERLHCIATRISKRGNLSHDSHIKN